MLIWRRLLFVAGWDPQQLQELFEGEYNREVGASCHATSKKKLTLLSIYARTATMGSLKLCHAGNESDNDRGQYHQMERPRRYVVADCKPGKSHSSATGGAYSAGDVLLDIETDKAQMDVEAQDDGILAKIILPDGSKSVKVGARIAIMAEPGDDLKTLQVPSDESTSAPTSSQTRSDSSTKQETPARSLQDQAKAMPDPRQSKGTSQPPQKYPLYPAVQALLRENGIIAEDVNRIPASGPNGRLLKGDVLSWLGRIKSDYSARQSTRISKMGHLDFSNVQRAQPKPQSKPVPPKAEPFPGPEPDTEIAVSISLNAVLTTQKRIQDTLGLVLPLSTFIARASEIANEDLPRAKYAPTADELYDAVLGLDTVNKKARGAFAPNVTSLSSEPLVGKSIKRPVNDDIIDILTGKSKTKHRDVEAVMPPAARAPSGNTVNLFSVSAKKGEEKRARTYLERIKTVLEADPGRCVL